MSSTVVTQSRMASLMASFSVREPDGHRHHLGAQQPHAEDVERLAPTSSSPMYTAHSSPSSAATVAVATPCWPAPVSAMMRGLAHALGQQGLAEALLILCAPVWLRSSRLRTDRGPDLLARAEH